MIARQQTRKPAAHASTTPPRARPLAASRQRLTATAAPATSPTTRTPAGATTLDTTNHTVAALRERRDTAERLVALAAHLPPADRAFIEALYAHGMSVQRLARMLNRRESSIRRRARRLLARLADPRFTFVIRHAPTWPAARRDVAIASICEGRSQREIARTLRLTVHRVRAHLHELNTLFTDHARHHDAP